MELEIMLLIIAFVAICYGVWRHNSRKLSKPRERWEQFGRRSSEEREEKDQRTK